MDGHVGSSANEDDPILFSNFLLTVSPFFFLLYTTFSVDKISRVIQKTLLFLCRKRLSPSSSVNSLRLNRLSLLSAFWFFSFWYLNEYTLTWHRVKHWSIGVLIKVFNRQLRSDSKTGRIFFRFLCLFGLQIDLLKLPEMWFFLAMIAVTLYMKFFPNFFHLLPAQLDFY